MIKLVENAAVRPGWRALLDRFVADAAAIDGAGEIEIVEARDVYGRLEFRFEFAGRPPSDVEHLVYKRRLDVIRQSEHVCVECGASGLRHDWSECVFAPLCPSHARDEIAAASLAQYRHDDWHLKPSFEIVGADGNAFSSEELAERDVAAAQAAATNLFSDNEGADDWLAARWVSR